MGQSQSVDKYVTFAVVLCKQRFALDEEVSGVVNACVVQETPLDGLWVTLASGATVGVQLNVSQDAQFSQTIQVKRCADGTLKKGSYQFPFAFRLGGNLIPSINFAAKSDFARVTWQVSVSARAPGWFSRAKTVCQRTVDVGGEAARSNQPLVTRCDLSIDSGFAMFRSKGSATVHGRLEQFIYRAGDTCFVTLFLKNDSNVVIDLGSVKLLETVRLRSKGETSTHHNNKWTLAVEGALARSEAWEPSGKGASAGQREERASFGAIGKETAVRFSVTLPANVPLESFALAKVAVTHKLIVKLQPRAVFGAAMLVELPLCLRRPDSGADPLTAGVYGSPLTAIPVAQVVGAEYGDASAVPLFTPAPAPAPAPACSAHEPAKAPQCGSVGLT